MTLTTAGQRRQRRDKDDNGGTLTTAGQRRQRQDKDRIITKTITPKTVGQRHLSLIEDEKNLYFITILCFGIRSKAL